MGETKRDGSNEISSLLKAQIFSTISIPVQSSIPLLFHPISCHQNLSLAFSCFPDIFCRQVTKCPKCTFSYFPDYVSMSVEGLQSHYKEIYTKSHPLAWADAEVTVKDFFCSPELVDEEG